MSKLADIAFAVWDYLFGDDEACRWTIIGGWFLVFLGVMLPWAIGRWVVYTGLALDFVAIGVRWYRHDQRVKLERKQRLSFRVPRLRESAQPDRSEDRLPPSKSQ